MDDRSRTIGDWLGAAFVVGTMGLVALPGYRLMLAYLLRGEIQPVISLIALVLGGYWAVSLLAERCADALASRATENEPGSSDCPRTDAAPRQKAPSIPKPTLGPVVPGFRYRRDLIDRVRHGPPLIVPRPTGPNRAR